MVTHQERIIGIEDRLPTAGRKAKVRMAREYRKSHYRHLRTLGPAGVDETKKAIAKYEEANPLPKWVKVPDAVKKAA